MNKASSVSQNYKGVFDSRVGFGRNPVLLNVDFTVSYVDEDSPFYAPGVASAVAQSVELLDLARGLDIPVVHTRVVYHPGGSDGGIFVEKVPLLRRLTERDPMSQIVPEFEPRSGEVVIRKQFPSAFFATPLAPILISRAVDTVILIGCTTSGCIRATAVDAMQYGFRVIVPRECVGDRHPGPHEANLFDIDRKYGDVMSRADVMARLASQSDGLQF